MTSQHLPASQRNKNNSIQKPSTKPAPAQTSAAPASPQSAVPDPLSASPEQMLQLQQRAGNRAVQRMIRRAQSDEAQRAAEVGLEGGEVSGSLQSQIESARGGGRPLDRAVGQQIGGALGADFSGVRVHTDSRADGLNRSLSAKAFTLGSDVFFSQGAYNPGTHSGKQLLAHELTHVVQQGGGASNRVQTKLTVGPAGDKYEADADWVAGQVMRQLYSVGDSGAIEEGATGIARQIDIGRSAPAGTIQRAVGFEFQTGWGLVRNMSDTYVPHTRGRANDPDPETQADWEDTAVDHPNFPAPAPPPAAPPLTKWQRFKKWVKRKLGLGGGQVVAPPAGPVTDAQGREKISDTQWKDPNLDNTVVTRPQANRAHYKFFKGQVLKKYGAHVQMSVDDATTPLGAELEWVIHPPIQESVDVQYVSDVMDELGTAVNDLLAFKDRDSFLLSEATRDDADSGVELQPGIKGGDSRTMKAAAQMTGGISIDKLLTMFKEVGKGEALGVDKAAPGKSELDKGAQGLKGISGGVGENAAAVGDKVAGSARLKGLVAFIARYLSMGRLQGADPYKGALNYAKAGTVFLARTDFAKMFAMLPDDERQRFEADPDSFVDLVNTATGGAYDMDKMVLERGVKKDARKRNGGVGDIHYRVNVTRRQWLKGIAEGKDLLSSKNADAKAAGYGDDLESMGNLGTKTDKVGGDTGTDRSKYTGVVLEFRGNTTPQTPDKWKAYAVNAFKYVKELNSR